MGFPFPSTPNLRNGRNARGRSPVSSRYHIGAILPNSEPVRQCLRTDQCGGFTNSIFLMIEPPDPSLRLWLEKTYQSLKDLDHELFEV